MTEISIYVGEKLRQRRKKLNLSQSNLAKMLGVSSQQIHKYETGSNKISASMLYECANMLNVPISYFYDGMALNQKLVDIKKQSKNLCRKRTLPLNILLVEDNPTDEMLVREALAVCGYATVLNAAHDGEQAIRFLKNKTNVINFFRPDIILLDLNLPKRNGFEVIKELKSDRDTTDIPVIALTNSVNSDDMYKSYRMGASGFISKSFDINEFNSNIKSTVHYWSKIMVLPSMQSTRRKEVKPKNIEIDEDTFAEAV